MSYDELQPNHGELAQMLFSFVARFLPVWGNLSPISISKLISRRYFCLFKENYRDIPLNEGLNLDCDYIVQNQLKKFVEC
jgi:hypothetical protein